MCCVPVADTKFITFENTPYMRQDKNNSNSLGSPPALLLTLFLHLGQKLVQDHHLATVHHQVEVGRVGGSGLGTVKQVWMVTALPQLHEDVQQTHLVHLARRVQDVNVLHQNLGVPGDSEPRAVQSAAPAICLSHAEHGG